MFIMYYAKIFDDGGTQYLVFTSDFKFHAGQLRCKVNAEDDDFLLYQ